MIDRVLFGVGEQLAHRNLKRPRKTLGQISGWLKLPALNVGKHRLLNSDVGREILLREAV
jgi:hypothetical protein